MTRSILKPLFETEIWHINVVLCWTYSIKYSWFLRFTNKSHGKDTKKVTWSTDYRC